MKPNADIIDETTARTLLDRWYDGTATTADEDALTQYFTASANIPEDMKADAAIFGLPAETSQSMSEDIPSDLMAQVNGAIIAEKARKRRHSFWYTAASAAACACIVLVLSLSGNTELTTITDNTYANAVQKPQKSDSKAQTITPSDIEESAENDTQAEVSTATTQQAKPRYAQVAKTHDDYYNVSDPAEAERIQLEVAALLSQSINSTGNVAEKAIRDAGKVTDRANRTSAKAVAEIIDKSISGF